MKKNILLTLMLFALLLTACEYDNYETPQSVLSGRIIYNNDPLSVRSATNQLELWQDGYELNNKIPVYISWDGTFHSTLFDGKYKLVRLGGAPWENQTDTISVTVQGNTIIDVPVVPYFILNDVNFQKQDNLIIATFKINKISASASLSTVTMYMGSTILTDNSNNIAKASIPVSTVVLGNESTIKLAVPVSASSNNFIYVRIGIQNSGVGELIYSLPQKIQLK